MSDPNHTNSEDDDSDYDYGFANDSAKDEARPTVILMGLKRFVAYF